MTLYFKVLLLLTACIKYVSFLFLFHMLYCIIIIEPPISPNPSIMNPNASSILFQWSPPFLWLGQAINYYDIFITNNAGETLYYRVNTTFSDAVVSFTATVANYPDPILSCNDLHFSLSAVGSDQAKLPSFSATGGYIPGIYTYNNTAIAHHNLRLSRHKHAVLRSSFSCNFNIINVFNLTYGCTHCI